MSNPIPSSLALTNIADGSPRIAAPVRNNFTDTQMTVNELITALSGGALGQFLEAVDGTHVQWAKPPGTLLDSVQNSALSQTISASTDGTAVAVTGLTGNAVAYDGSQVMVEWLIPFYTETGGANPRIIAMCDTTEIGSVEYGALGGSINTRVPYTPSPGTHTFSLKAYQVNGTNITLQGGAGGSNTFVPAYLRVTKA